jgi:hypothetical protein
VFRIGLITAATIGWMVAPSVGLAEDDLDFLLDAPAPLDGATEALVPAGDVNPTDLRKIAGGLHDGHAFGPRVRPDGAWVAYGVREAVKGTFKTGWYARPLDGDGMFRSIWPNQHPSFVKGEGTASFTDLTGFEWAVDGNHNAMVALHKSKGEEVLLETMNVRFSGPGAQRMPAIAPDGTRLVVVSDSEDGDSTDLWVSDTVDGAEPLQLTFTKESETAPAWHPKLGRIIFEQRNPLGGDIWEFDLDTFGQKPLVKEGISDEISPSYSPNGEQFAFLSNKDDPQGFRYDLFVARPGDPLPKPVIRGVRRSDKSRGYAWDPLGRYVIAPVDDEAAGYPLMVAPVDGSKPAVKLADTRDNMDPTVIAIGETSRVVWVALDMDRPADRRYRIVFARDYSLAEFGRQVGL